jgi:hypothetical protein
MSSWRVVTTGLALVLCAILALPDPGYGRSGARTGSQSRGGSHLYVLLGLGNNSPNWPPAAKSRCRFRSVHRYQYVEHACGGVEWHARVDDLCIDPFGFQ